jgi:Secretion system C-terminal sorting domain
MRTLLLATLLAISFFGIAQNPNNHWQLGASDVNFTTDPPVVTTVANNGQYGNAAVSDSSGNLLFYTDGVRVFNKAYQVMQGGEYIGYNYPSDINRQPAIILPYPGNNNKFYIFNALNEHTLCLGCSDFVLYKCYLIDFENPQYPLGVVIGTSFNNGSRVNTANFGPLTVVRNASNDGYFVIIHRTPSTGNGGVYESYKITNLGLDTQPVSTYISNDIGYYSINTGGLYASTSAVMKFTPDYSKLGELLILTRRDPSTGAYSYSSKFFTFDFNRTTGTFSNYRLVEDRPTNLGASVDFEFSADSKKVYSVSDKVYVKDLLNIALPARDLFQVGTSTVPSGFKHIQRDRYNNILIKSGNYLSKIDAQNSYSASSILLNYLPISISIEQFNYSSLPQLIPTDVTFSAPISAANDVGSATVGIASMPIVNVLSNDTYNNALATFSNVTLSFVSSTNSGITLDTTTGAVNITSFVPLGIYTLTYSICDRNNASNCVTGLVTITTRNVGVKPSFYTVESPNINNNTVIIRLVSDNGISLFEQGITSVVWTRLTSTRGGKINGKGFSGIASGLSGWTIEISIKATNAWGTTEVIRSIESPGTIDPCATKSSSRIIPCLRQATQKVAIDDVQIKNQIGSISIFPNPTNGAFKIGLHNLDQGTIEISDFLGTTFIRSIFENQSEIDISIQDRPKGIYVVKIISGDQVFVERVLLD